MKYMTIICSLLVLNCTLLAQVKPYNLNNCVTKFSMEKTESTNAGYQFWFVNKTFTGDGKTLKLMVAAPGKGMHEEPHKHEEDKFFFILEGEAEFYLDGNTTKVGPYTSLYCPANVMHRIRNAGKTDLKYLVIRQYPLN